MLLCDSYFLELNHKEISSRKKGGGVGKKGKEKKRKGKDRAGGFKKKAM